MTEYRVKDLLRDLSTMNPEAIVVVPGPDATFRRVRVRQNTTEPADVLYEDRVLFVGLPEEERYAGAEREEVCVFTFKSRDWVLDGY